MLPDIKGGELVLRLRSEKPGLKAIVMSGYNTDDIIRRNPGVAVIQKPFALTALLRKIDEMIAA